jgi:signal transduction histidine kinase
MSFLITARTILHLGSDLISSDAVALYELIKNAIDAKSKTGVDVQFDIVIRQSDFAAAMGLLDEDDENISLDEVKQTLLGRVSLEAAEELRDKFTAAVKGAKSKASLRRAAHQAYRECNRVVVSDTGHGMTRQDLKEIYLTIGTTHRAKAVRAALQTGIEQPPYLGEKGVGRLSVMRLGWKVHIETVTESEHETNILEIDWRKFEEADDAEASSVHLEPKAGNAKAGGASFTRITISDLRSSWSLSRLTQIATEQIARMTDPFSWTGRRFQVRLMLNGVPVQPVRAVVRELLQQAHGRCIGEFSIKDGKPVMTARIESTLYSGDPTEINFDLVDLMSMSGLRESGQPSSVLRTLGTFSFEMYWFNRQRLRALPDVGDRETVRRLVKMWAGVCLFRDGYRVLPYGDEGDDWLGLDLTALASSGYKLNTKQIIGRVSIGRLTNPRLLDQTNRQGLIETPEKEVLIVLLRELVSRWWHDYLNEASRAQKRTEESSFDSTEEASVVDALEVRATQSLKEIRGQYTGEAQLLREVKDAFTEIKEAHQRAVQRILTIEEEKERLTQLAGVGLMVEVIAHELTRATELTQSTLKDLSRRSIDEAAAAALRTLGQQIKVIQKRLQTLEPLSITARFRRAKMRLANIVQYVLEGHTAQFERHKIIYSLSPQSDLDTIAFVVEGHVVQILENLINNSVYWLDLERKEHPSFEPCVCVRILSNPSRIIYSDNGPGIPKSRRESVFEPFFSTKSGAKSRRQGLGLYIARQNAEALGGALNLIEMGNPHENRYNTFQLALKEGVNES